MASTPEVSINTGSFSEQFADASRYFLGQGNVNYALGQLVVDLRKHDIDYVVIGAVALFAYGRRRVTNNIDIVLTADGLARFITAISGKAPQTVRHYDPDITSNKRVRSVRYGISINVMTSSEFPGDGKPKPVQIPDPADVATEIGGVRYVTFEKLIELKLASGISAPDRLKDLADVQELIGVRPLPREFAERLNPYVREKFLELWDSCQNHLR